MKRYFLLTVIIVSVLFSGCECYSDFYRGLYYKNMEFNYSTDLDSCFFRYIPEVSAAMEKENKVKGIKAINIFTVTFAETYIEDNNVLNYTVHDSSKVPPVRYTTALGDTQRVFLIELVPTNQIDYSPIVYFSAKYKKGQCIGFGPAYLGYAKARPWYNEPPVYVIDFKAELKVGREDGKLLLEPEDKLRKVRKGRATDMIFVLNGPVKAGNPLAIQKVVIRSNNKIGGDKPMMFDVDKEFGEKNAFTLRSAGTITFKQ